MRPSSTTVVSTPSVSRPSRGRSGPCPPRARARARRARRPAGRPRRTSGATTSNGIRSCSRIARRCGDVDARVSAVLRAAQISSAGPLARPVGGDSRRSTRASVASSGRRARRAARPRSPCARSRSIQSPCASWNSTPSSGVHSIRCMPTLRTLKRLGRRVGPRRERRASRAALLRRKTSRPPGRSRRAASGIQRYGSHQMLAPYSETARSKLASGSGTSSALASISGNTMPVSSCTRRAVSSWAGVTSTPTGRAPCLASQRGEVRRAAAELDDVEARDVPEDVERRSRERRRRPR